MRTKGPEIVTPCNKSVPTQAFHYQTALACVVISTQPERSRK
jgi:hypothetical protein